jgi:RNA polymerase sigma factor (sigma-70 family)
VYGAETVDIGAGASPLADADRRALIATLFRQEGPSLVRLARLFSDDRTAAEDLVQEAFIRLYHSAHRVRDADRMPAYLRSIVLNLARDHNRRGLLSLRHQEPAGTLTRPLEPDEQVVRTESQARVVLALGGLSQRQRDCLVLRFFLDLTEREIADTLHISPNSVKTHIRRGMAALRSLLEDER